MNSRQQGFTLVEIVVAFTILAMSTVLVVNLVTQSSIRVSQVNNQLASMDALESALAVVRGEIASRYRRQDYSGRLGGEYRWEANVIGTANSARNMEKRDLNLYRVRIRIYDNSPLPRLELTTIIPDR